MRTLVIPIFCVPLLWGVSGSGAIAQIAQSITAAPDGTGTQITLDGHTYHIQGGTQAGANLFHSFEQFGLRGGEIANFLSNPSITHIFGRIVGGDPSLINGLIQAQPNLYLMNPAGILFGAGARLDVGGDFFATTADRIGFAGGWFEAVGDNAYATLVGAPNQFAFLSATPSAVINTGTLTSGQGITFLGGTVIQGGAIAAPTVTLAAVPGTRLVNVAQTGMLLSLDLPQEALTAGIAPTDLPHLLTASGLEGPQSVTVGDVHLAGPVMAKQADFLAAGRVTVDGPGLVSGEARVVRFSETGDNPDRAVFIDARVDDPEALLFGAEAGTVAQIIHRDRNGVAQVAEQLTQIRDAVGELESVAIAAEGHQGNFWLGNQWITPQTVTDHSAHLQAWGDTLSDDAALLLYSCFTALGAAGEALVNSLARLTGANVAASVDATSSQNYGGNWQLEYSTGAIALDNPFTAQTLSQWDGKLATLTVTTLDNTGTDSLRDILQTQATNGDLITFAPGLTGTILLSGVTSGVDGEITWATNNLTLDGDRRITIDGNANSRIFNISAENATLDNLTLQNGRLNYTYSGVYGGGIAHSGTGLLTLNNTTVSNHAANQQGGGIWSSGNVALFSSSIINNSATFQGGGIWSEGSVTLTSSSVSGNSTGNTIGTASGQGGGIWSNGPVTLTSSTVSGNSVGFSGATNVSSFAGGGIWSNSNVTLTSSSISNNSSAGSGGGIWSDHGVSITNYLGDLNLDVRARNAVNVEGSGSMIITGDIQTDGHNFTMNAADTINISGLALATHNSNSSGDISLTAGRNILARELTTATTNINSVKTGDISLTSTGGQVDLLSTGGSGAIVASSAGDRAGNVTIRSPQGISTGLINTEALNGVGGSVSLISDQFVRVQGALAAASNGGSVFNEFESSISSVGRTAGGSILIQHGGNGSVPFVVGDAGQNGTSAAITAGTGYTILPTNFYFTNHAQPGIQILTNVPTPSNGSNTGTLPPLTNLQQNQIAQVISGTRPVNQSLDTQELIRRIGRQLDAETVFDEQGQFTWQLPGDRASGGSLRDNVILQAFIRLDTSLTEQFSGLTGVNTDAITPSEDPVSTDEESEDEDRENSVTGILETFSRIQSQTGTTPALLYVLSQPNAVELILITPDEQLFRTLVPEANRTLLQNTIREFRRNIANIRRPNAYLESAQQLYRWIIQPIEDRIDNLEVDTLIFAMGEELRTLPLAALHDGDQFLIEKYSIGQIPSLSLTNSDYQPLHEVQTLVMGASEFNHLMPLDFVPEEAETIAALLNGEVYLNEEFTHDNLVRQSRDRAFDIVHLATHAEFKGVGNENSFIQLWDDEQLPPHELRNLRWYESPQVELLVLSACVTAVGDREAELGFAGLAVQAGVKSAMASLWYVSDVGTLALMSEFYQNLSDPNIPIKAEALRQAQLALLRNEFDVAIAPSSKRLTTTNFSHPYYWSSFMMVGSPW